MTPPSHLLIGFSLAHIVYALQKLFKKSWFSLPVLLLLVGVYAMLPDIDSFFGYYTSRDPVLGHRGITHSIIGIILFGLLGAAVYYSGLLFRKKDHKLKQSAVFFTVLFCAGLTHLVADLPQPPGTWRGIPLFYPLKIDGEYYRIGGWSLIGWYDIKITVNLMYLFLISLLFVTIYRLDFQMFSKKLKYVMLVILLSINVTMILWVTLYIYSAPLNKNRHWGKYQKKIISELPYPVRLFVQSGNKQIIKIFRKVTH